MARARDVTFSCIMPKAKKPINTMVILDEDGRKQNVTEVGIPGLFQPQRCDIEEEFQNNEALRELRRERMDDYY
jgi:hypothetical protein